MAGGFSEKTSSDSRIRFLAGVFLLGVLLIIFRVFYLQVVSAGYWKQVASSQHGGKLTLDATRGEVQVSDTKSGEAVVVATNIEQPFVYIVPGKIIDANKTALLLSKVLEIDENEVKSKILDTSRKYVVLKKEITREKADEVGALKLEGVGVDEELQRFYPHGSLLASVLGFVGYKDGSALKQGLYGIERSFEPSLAGKAGKLEQDRASKTSVWIFGGKRDFVPAINGDSLLLTIDLSVQRKIEEVLRKTVEKHSADRGCALVMDPYNGNILGMASFPDFDPNTFNKVSDPAVYNNVCLSSYEPGSVFKPITMAASIDAGKITPDTTYNDTGQVKLDGFTIKNSDFKAHGVVNMTTVLEESLNTGAIYAKDQLGDANFLKWVRKFGFGAETGVELPESTGNLKNLDSGGSVHFATASFGQGISTTPLQMLRSYAVIANGGRQVSPHILQSQIKFDGERKDNEKALGEQILKSTTATSLAGMLVSVVEKGHGKKAKVEGFSVAGKTGTAQVVLPGEKGYDEHKTIGTFVGFAPAYNPKFVALVRIDNPSTVQFAESTAAPAFGEIMRYLLDRFDVPPDREAGK